MIDNEYSELASYGLRIIEYEYVKKSIQIINIIYK